MVTYNGEMIPLYSYLQKVCVFAPAVCLKKIQVGEVHEIQIQSDQPLYPPIRWRSVTSNP